MVYFNEDTKKVTLAFDSVRDLCRLEECLSFKLRFTYSDNERKMLQLLLDEIRSFYVMASEQAGFSLGDVDFLLSRFDDYESFI